jgi:hypothetical protein
LTDRLRPWLGVLGNVAVLAAIGGLYLWDRPLSHGLTERGIILTAALLYVVAMTLRRIAAAWPRRMAPPPS